MMVESAAHLFALAGVVIPHSGVVLRFSDGCPSCAIQYAPPGVFTVDRDSFPACQATA
jgi:hypothetical protein